MWAAKFTIPVSWPDAYATEAGAGEVAVWLRLDIRNDGDSVAQVCGVTVPAYQTKNTHGEEHYQIAFPMAMFDSPLAPTFSFPLHMSRTQTGTAITIDNAALWFGAATAEPISKAWGTIGPTDDDRNGYPGVTLISEMRDGLIAPAVDMFRLHRADKFHVAARFTFSAEGEIPSCVKAGGALRLAS